MIPITLYNSGKHDTQIPTKGDMEVIVYSLFVLFQLLNIERCN